MICPRRSACQHFEPYSSWRGSLRTPATSGDGPGSFDRAGPQTEFALSKNIMTKYRPLGPSKINSRQDIGTFSNSLLSHTAILVNELGWSTLRPHDLLPTHGRPNSPTTLSTGLRSPKNDTRAAQQLQLHRGVAEMGLAILRPGTHPETKSRRLSVPGRMTRSKRLFAGDYEQGF